MARRAITEQDMDMDVDMAMFTEPLTMCLIRPSGIMYLVTDTGTVVEIGTLMTIGVIMEMAGLGTEIIGGWGREDAGNKSVQGGYIAPAEQTVKSKTTDK